LNYIVELAAALAKEKALDREIKGFPLKLVANQGFEPRTCGL